MNTLLIIISVLLNCAAQLLIRKGMLIEGEVRMHNMISHLGTMFANIWLWSAMLCYAVSILLWISVLSKVEVSYAYPFLSIGYVLSAGAGYFLFNENVSPIRIVGIVVICIGVILISRS